MKTAFALATAALALAACGGPKAPQNTASGPSPTSSIMNTANNSTGLDPFTAHLPSGFSMPNEEVGKRLLKEYGAIFVTRDGTAPKVVIFKDAAAVEAFQTIVPRASETIAGVKIELQAPAMQALKEALSEAAASGLTITPRGTDAAKRSYDDTVELWKSRVGPGLDHWTTAGRVSADEAKRIISLQPYEQVPEIFKLEDQGIFFSKDLSKSIIYSVAPPGASQHLSMLALDIAEFDDANARSTLARHGWFQTVVSDLPHFTYMGVDEVELPNLGLKKVMNADRVFWVPDL
jgi:hypothetical protein